MINGLQVAEVLRQAAHFRRPFDAIVLDLTLGGHDGLDVLRAMRAAKDFTPVLILSARSALAERVAGLEIGADDYLSKPAAPIEIIARLRAISRRGAQSRDVQPSLGNLEFDTGRGLFTVEGTLLSLTPKMQSVMEALFRRRGSIVRKDFLMTMDGDVASEDSVDTVMSRLRRKLREAGATATIRNHKGTGFSLELEAAETHAHALMG
jgi:DNA-binding response OmpR family regulator